MNEIFCTRYQGYINITMHSCTPTYLHVRSRHASYHKHCLPFALPYLGIRPEFLLLDGMCQKGGATKSFRS
jgi:hypothetical protein